MKSNQKIFVGRNIPVLYLQCIAENVYQQHSLRRITVRHHIISISIQIFNETYLSRDNYKPDGKTSI